MKKMSWKFMQISYISKCLFLCLMSRHMCDLLHLRQQLNRKFISNQLLTCIPVTRSSGPEFSESGDVQLRLQMSPVFSFSILRSASWMFSEFSAGTEPASTNWQQVFQNKVAEATGGTDSADPGTGLSRQAGNGQSAAATAQWVPSWVVERSADWG